MVRTKGSFLACAVLLNASWANNNNLNKFSTSGAIRPPGVLQDRHRVLQTPCPRRAGSAGNAELGTHFHRLFNRGKGEGAIDCEGKLRRGWRKAFVPPSALFRSSARVRSSRGGRNPCWQQQLPSAEVTFRCGCLANPCPRRRGFMRRYEAVTPIKMSGQDGDAVTPMKMSGQDGDAGGLSPRRPTATKDGHARPKIPKWAHKAVIIPG